MKRIQNNSVAPHAGAALSGLLLTASFPNLGSPLIAWFAIVPLLASLRNSSPAESMRLGYLCGIIHFATLIYWIIPCLKTYGMLPLYLSLIVLFLFTAYLSLFIAGFAMAVNWGLRNAKMLFIVAPVFWVAFEYARAHLFTGFPWELLGYSQYRILPLIQMADVTGVYGVSWLVAMGNCAVFLMGLSLSGLQWNRQVLSKKHALASLACFTIIFALAWGYGVWRMGNVEKAMAAATAKRISIIQGNIAQQMKWDPAFQTDTIDRYIALSQKESAAAPHLVVWPETAMPFYFGHNAPLTRRVLKGIQPTQTDYIISSPGLIRQEGSVEYRNRAFLLNAGPGTVSGTYDKAHLVPFGEYVPLQKWLPFIGKLVAQVGDFSAGEKGANLEWGQHNIGMLICYELIFPYLSREATRKGAHLLVNITNDAWYGRTSAPFQHFSMAVFRAVENRRALARSANTGISGFIEPTGKIIATTPIFEKASATATLPLLKISTLYVSFGDWFSLICVVISIGAIAYRIFDLKRSRK